MLTADGIRIAVFYTKVYNRGPAAKDRRLT
jgi:hypothetical protein